MKATLKGMAGMLVRNFLHLNNEYVWKLADRMAAKVTKVKLEEER